MNVRFSWFQMISFHPPSIIISPANAPRRKDTTQNILDTKQFTVNIISEPFVENANACAIDAPEDFNEWPLSGLTREPSTFVKPARVKESAFSMECELLQAIDVRHPEYDRPDLGDGLTTLIIGVVRYIHARKDVLNDQELVDVVKPQPVSRLGDISFGRVGNLYRLKRYKWEEEKENIKAALKQ
ncbi:hypothetical protein DACRYDRAFT_112364 [Dacryopinax primogenitus]|uniref:Flavin reductase like domain-containing protein n=1 Tax=Dacryopinax primogenitus (strain DJM 731) TaxID=1858805 RepID=M5FPF5_DACPD|nr:uncharacterized protein DACRYDRAFT_112364 [Dacryopinax primogenitus]EJT97038.1 hypothetical protein DACRYDRAFT_112364 [Dacryopinax primogenitus]